MRGSRQYKWLSWVIYDTNYRRHVADIGQRDWSKVDPGALAGCGTLHGALFVYHTNTPLKLDAWKIAFN